METVEQCMRENTFGLNVNQKVTNFSLWSSNIATVYTGQCHTFNYPHPLSSHINTDSFLFYLDPSLSYRIIIHDPKYFHVLANSLAFPRIWLDFEWSGTELRSIHMSWSFI